MKIVVTGATSFIGAPMTKELVKQGHDVYAVVRPGSRNMGKLPQPESRLHVIEKKLQEADELHQVIPASCDMFFHFGWDGTGSDNRRNREVQQRNVADSLKALEGARALGCKAFLFSGSQAEYGVCQEVMEEAAPLKPVSEYGKAKADFGRQAMETVKRWEGQGEGIRYLHARIFSVYGPGDHTGSLVESCLRTFWAGEYISLGECTQQWNYLYLDDLIKALLALWEKGESGIYNVAGEAKETRPLKEYVRLLYEACGLCGSYSFGRRPQNAEGPANLLPDTTRLLTASGWRQETSFAEGIRRLIERTGVGIHGR